MTSPHHHALATLRGAELGEYLTANSGLPGPRANLELVDAFAATASNEQIREFSASNDEYLRLCGTVGLAALVLRGAGDAVLRLEQNASDSRWRVREGVARALQFVGDENAELLRITSNRWAQNRDPLVQRAAIAAICEPRLLKDPATASLALELCRRVTVLLAAVPLDGRRRDDVRVLRQALGYCWSVAIAAAPAPGLDLFAELEASSDADLQWVVRENRKKARLQRLL